MVEIAVFILLLILALALISVLRIDPTAKQVLYVVVAIVAILWLLRHGGLI